MVPQLWRVPPCGSFPSFGACWLSEMDKYFPHGPEPRVREPHPVQVLSFQCTYALGVWHVPVIALLQRQEHRKFKANLGCTVT
jgi:hypothetical protein